MKRKTPHRDWLYAKTNYKVVPPGPISGPIESHHDPEVPLSGFRNEQCWSEEIVAWSKAHAHELDHQLDLVAVEE
jgi:hypothetical protein